MAATAMQAEELRNAFEVFNRQSTLLEASYRQLQDKVELLTRQLHDARSQRLQELEDKEHLSRHLANLLESMPGAILVIDGAGVIRECNSEARLLLNQPLLGCAWSAIVRREAGDDSGQDGNLRLRDGRWVSLSRRPLTEEQGEILLLADVTESREILQMHQRQERLTAIGEMTATFAHQVRTPLASALLYAAKLENGGDEQRRVAQKVTARLQDVGRMVNDMLGFAAGSRNSEESADVRMLLDGVRQTIEPHLGAEVTLNVDNETPSVRVAGNPDALKGAVLNLVTNACQACDDAGQVWLAARRSGGDVIIEVSDDGHGIDADALPRLFEPFFTTRPQGTGLGLAVVKAVATAQGGEVSVDSSSHGSVFTLRLPIAETTAGGSGNV